MKRDRDHNFHLFKMIDFHDTSSEWDHAYPYNCLLHTPSSTFNNATYFVLEKLLNSASSQSKEKAVKDPKNKNTFELNKESK